MVFCYGKTIDEIRKIVKDKSMYQKVMFVFDDYVSNFQTIEIYESIKDFCVYNQTHIKDLSKNEIYNGYKLIIYFCESNSLLKCDINKDEFINVFILKDGILPAILNCDSSKVNSEVFILFNNSTIDYSLVPSINLNKFYQCLNNLLMLNESAYNEIFNLQVSRTAIEECVGSIEKEMMFVDVDILKIMDIEYKDLIFVDLLIIDAFLLLITNIKNQNLMIADIYKMAKDDDEMIDRFYKLYNDKTFYNMIILNYNFLYNNCIKVKKSILDVIALSDYNEDKIYCILKKVKEYSKRAKGLFSYLSLYDIINC